MFDKSLVLVNVNEFVTTFVINRTFDRLLQNDLENAEALLVGITLDYATTKDVRVYENEYVGQLVLNRILNRLFLNDKKIFDHMEKSVFDKLPFGTVEEILLYENEYFSINSFNRCINRLHTNDSYLNPNYP